MTAPPSLPGDTPPAGDVPVSFWLLPGVADAQWLRNVVRDLAQRHGGPTFEPHLTLHEATCRPDADIEGLLRAHVAGFPPLTLAALATAESDDYYRTLFVDIDSDALDGARLLDLRRQLALASLDLRAAGVAPREGPSAAGEREQAPSDDSFRPHVSLLYANLTRPERAALAERLDFRGRSIRFDRLAAVRPVAGRPDLSRVADWDVFGHCRLSG